MQFTVYICVSLFLSLIGCKTPLSSDFASKDHRKEFVPPDYAGAKSISLNSEYIPHNEKLYFQKITSDFLKIHKDQTKKMQITEARRGMHVKDHGCFEADFVVLNNAENLRQGIFAEPKTFNAVVRFSNGSGIAQADFERDLRGFAVKIQSPDISTLMDNMEAGTQDFLMTNAPKHHAKDIVELMGFIDASHQGGAVKAAFLANHFRLMKTLLSQTEKKVGSLLNESYYSRSAFRMGKDQTMRFETTPCGLVNAVKSESEEYLTEDLRKNLRPDKKVCFNFSVRIQTDAVLDPIEDHSVEWQSEAQRVAVIHIYGDRRLDSTQCEALRFNPWNAHADHQPLGNFNRARLHIYNAAWNYRKVK